MSEMAHMDITIDLTLKSRLAALADATHRDESALVGEAIAYFLDVQDWQRARIEKGIAAAERGEFVTPEEVERVFTKYQPRNP
jgi:predicted transcriptional regulator